MNKGVGKVALGIALSIFLSTVSYAMSAALAAPSAPAPNTLPTGGQVKQGSATITTNNVNNNAVMNIQQETNRVVINWQSFNVGSSSTVNFRQPSVASIALNRVVANDGMMSQIYGHINANGNIILINPNGILFGNGSQVNVAGIVASTADINISDADFVAGKSWGYKQSATTNGNITIQGSIIAETNGAQMDILGIEREKINTVSVLNNKIALIADGSVIVQDQINTGTVDAPVMTATNLNLEARTVTTAKSGLSTVGSEGFEIGSGSSYTAYSGIMIRADANADDIGTVELNNSNAANIKTSNIAIYYNPKSVAIDAVSSAYGTAYNQKDYSNYANEQAAYKDQISYAYTEKVTGEEGSNVERGTWATGKNVYALVNNIEQLQDIAAAKTGNLTATYALGQNIDASATAKWNNGEGFRPIGDTENSFSGKFFGDGGIATYWINDLSINNKSADNVGLFGVTQNAALEQVDMARANISGNNNVGAVVGSMNGGYLYGSVIYGDVSGQQNVGGLVGNTQKNATLIYNINVANVSAQQNVGGIGGNVENSNIVGNVNYGPVTNLAGDRISGNTGGIVGSMVDTQLSGSQNYGAVTSSNAQNTGGIAGYMGGDSTIKGMAMNNGQISGTDNVGGLVGKMDAGRIDTAYNTNEQNTLNTFVNTTDSTQSTYGQVTGTGSNIGGLVGVMNSGSINNAYNAGNVSGKENVGGLVGSMNAGSITNSYNADNNTVFVDKNVGNINDPNTANYYGFKDVKGTQYYYERASQTTTVTMSDGKSLTMAPGDVIYYTISDGNKQYQYYNDLPQAAERINNVRLAYRDANISGSNNVGGVVGSMSGGSVDSVYNAGTVSLNNESTGAVGGLIGSKSGGADAKVSNSFNIAKDSTGLNKMSGQSNAIGVDDNSTSSNVQNISLQAGRVLTDGKTIFGTALADNGTWSIGQDQTLPLLQQGYMSKAGIRRVVEYDGSVNNLMTHDVSNLYGDAEFVAGSGQGRNVYNGDPRSITNEEYPQSTVYHYDSSNIWSPQHGYYMSDNSTLIITPKELTINISGSKTYGDSALSGYTYGNTQVGGGDYQVSASGFVSGESFETLNMSNLSYNGNSGGNFKNAQDSTRLNAGSYEISESIISGVTAANNNYQIQYTGGLNVNKAQLVVTAGTDTKTYDGTLQSTGGTITVAGLKNNDTASNFTQQFTNKNVQGIGGSTIAVVNSGYSIYKDGDNSVDASGNYAMSYVNAAGTINKANVTISGSRAYDGTRGASGSTFQVSSGLVGSEQLGFSGSTTIASANVDYYQTAGNQILGSWTGLSLANGSNGGLASNYQIVGASYAVTPKALTINISGSKTYGDNTLSGYTYGSTKVGSGNYTVTGSGFVEEESFNVLSNMGNLSYQGNSGSNLQYAADNNNLNAGTYSLSGAGFSGPTANHGNYNINYNGSLTVNRAALTITAVTDTKTYDGTVSSGAQAIVSGLKNSDTVTNLTEQFASKNALGTGGSTLKVVQSGYNVNKNGTETDGSGNYNVTYVDTSGTINKANVTVSGSKVYDGTTNAAGSTFQVTSGLVGSEKLGFSGSTTVASANVDYYQTAGNQTMSSWTGLNLANGSSGGLASNYQIVGSSYQVTPKSLTLSVSGSKTYGDAVLSGITATAGSGGYLVSGTGFVNGETMSVVDISGMSYKGNSGANFRHDQDSANLNAGTYSLASSGVSGVTANHGNYNISYSGGNLTVNKAALTITAVTDTKTYDGTVNSGAQAIVSGLKNSDTVTNLKEQFASKNALGTGGSTLKVVQSGYNVNKNGTATDGSGNYNVTYVDAAGTINKANVTVSGSKVYDGTTNAAGSTFQVTSGLVGSERLGFSGSTTVASANVDYYQTAGNQTMSSWTGLNLANGSSGGLASNYQIVGSSYQVTPKSLTISVSGSKTYGDAALSGVTTTAGNGGYLVSGTGFVNGENISVINTSGMSYKGNTGSNFQSDQDSANLNAGSYSLSGSGMGGATANHGNYNISYGGGNLTVNKAALTITAATDTKTYDGTVSSGAQAIVTGLKNSDTVTNLKEQFASKNALGTGGSTLKVVQSGYNVNKNGTATDGSGNYNVTYVDTTGTINKANITVSGSKAYDGTTNAASSTFQVTGGLVGNEKLGLSGSTTLASQNVDYYRNNPNMASWTGVGLTDGTSGGLASNYQITNAQYSITPQNVVLSVSGSKTYGDAALSGVTTTAGNSGYLVSGTGFVNNENMSVINTSGMSYKGNTGSNFQSDQDSANLNAGSYSLSGSGMSGATANHGNYNISYSGGNLTVNKAALTITAATDTKTYDGTVSSKAQTIVSGLKNSDTVTNLTQQFTDKNVHGEGGSTLQVVQSGYSVNKNGTATDGSGNYTVTFASNSGTITPAPISVSGTKAYDGNTATTAGDFHITSGLVGNEQLGLSGRTTLASQNVDTYQANHNMGTWSGLGLTDGASGGLASNYQITNAQYSITPQNVVLSVSGSKTYGDAALSGVTTTAGNSGYLVSGTGFVNGESMNVVDVSGMSYKGSSGTNFRHDQDNANLNAGNYSLDGASMGGATANHGNYNISYSGGNLTVNKAALTITAATDTKTYDGTVSSSAQAIVTGLKNSDTVTNLTEQFTDKNVQGTGGSTLKVVESGYNINKNGTITDGSGNYTVTFASNSGTITPAPISVSGTKAYDGNTATTAGDFHITSGLVGNEQLGLSGSTTLASQNVDYYRNNPNMASWTGVGLTDGASGGLASNYQITNAQYSITPRVLTINVSGSNKYDRVSINGFVANDNEQAADKYRVRTSGLVNGENLTNVTDINSAWARGGYQFSGDGIHNTNAGHYDYAPTGGVSATHGNYSIQYTGSFDVTPNTFYYVADNKVVMQGMPPGPYSGRIIDANGNAVTDSMLNNGKGAFVSNAVQGSAVGTYYIYGAGTRLDSNGRLVWVAGNYSIEQLPGNDNALRIVPNTTYQNEISSASGGYIEHSHISNIRFIHVQDSGINADMAIKRPRVTSEPERVRIEEDGQ